MGKETLNKKNRICVLSSNSEIIKLLQWCHMRDTQFRKLRITPAEFPIGAANDNDAEDYGGYRGICSLKRISSGEEVLFMPEACLVTSDAFPESIKKAELNLQEKFVVFLIAEMQKPECERLLSPYLNTLPKDFSSHHPGYLSDHQVELLPEWLSEILRAQISLLTQGFDKSCKLINALTNTSSDVTLDVYRWAWYTVYTRTVFFMRKKDDGTCTKEMALAPFLDLFNHAPEPNTEVVYKEGKGYSIVATKDILPMEQIFISYGPHPNYKLWIDYGFIPFQRNPNNCIPLNPKKLRESMWLESLYKDRRKVIFINEHGLLKELYLLETELSPNVELLIAVALWNPDVERFSYNVDKSTAFIEIAVDIITKQKDLLMNSLLSFSSLEKSSVVHSTENFLTDAISLCDKLRDLYGIASRSI